MIFSNTIGSPTVTVPAKVFAFELATGNTGVKTIVEPLLDTEERARERARREFLDNGYTKRLVTFTTHRTDLKLNNIISVHGLKFKVVSLTIASTLKKVTVTVGGVRYE